MVADRCHEVAASPHQPASAITPAESSATTPVSSHRPMPHQYRRTAPDILGTNRTDSPIIAPHKRRIVPGRSRLLTATMFAVCAAATRPKFGLLSFGLASISTCGWPASRSPRCTAGLSSVLNWLARIPPTLISVSHTHSSGTERSTKSGTGRRFGTTVGCSIGGAVKQITPTIQKFCVRMLEVSQWVRDLN